MTSSPSTSRCGVTSRWLSFRVAVLLAILGGGIPGCSAPKPAEPVATGVVTLEITGDGQTETLTLEDIPTRATVEEVMRRAIEQGLAVEMTGSGTTAFVHSIGDRAGSASEGWLFQVDGQFSDRGIGTTELDPPATVHWIYGDMTVAMQGAAEK